MDKVMIGNRIRETRKLRNITADELSERVSIAPVTLRHIENGANHTRLQTLAKIADVLGVSIDYILGRTTSPQATLAAEYREMYGLTDYQEKMLRDFIDSMIPVIKSYGDK